MKYKIVLLLVASLLFTACNKAEVTPSHFVKVEQESPKIIQKQMLKETVVWDSNSKSFLSQSEYDNVMLSYVKSKYPQEVKAYKLQQKREREKLIKNNTLVLGNLMWQDNSNVKSVKKNWFGAINYCKNLSLLGYSDWRLGSKNELMRLYQYKNKLNFFSSSTYWSSATYESDKRDAWFVNFLYGAVYNRNKHRYYYVRCVRDGH